MSDITEELARLADLKDRGVLTQAEFDEQKALLLHPAAAPAAAPVAPPLVAPPPVAPVIAPPPPRQGGSLVPILIVVGVLVVLVLGGGLLWASGLLSKFGHSPTPTVATVSSAPVVVASSAIAAPPALPVAPAPVVAQPIPNPLMGQWVSDSGGGSNCGGGLTFGESTVTISQPDGNGGMKQETSPLTYAVLSPTSVTLYPTNNPGQSKVIAIVDGSFMLESCRFHR